MKSLLFALMLYGLSVPALARAGNEFGDGGHVVQCRLSTYVSTELLDFFEARVGRGVQLVEHSPSMDVYEILSSHIRQIGRLDPERAARYDWLFLNFTLDVTYGTSLPLTHDSGDLAVTLPSYCELNQAIIRRVREDGLPFYEIGFLYRGLSPLHRAGILMHEIIYADAKASHGIEESHNVRAFNAYVFSRGFEATTPEIYAAMVRRLEANEP